MLPISKKQKIRPRGGLSALVRRSLQFSQLDFEVAAWQFLYLFLAPRKVYRNVYYQKQTKNKWARDDPAFILIQAAVLLVLGVIYGIVYYSGSVDGSGGSRMGGVLWKMLRFVLFDYLGTAFIVAFITWFIANRFLLTTSAHSVEQSVEFGYAFDVHCNGFCSLLLAFYILPVIWLPWEPGSPLLAAFIGNFVYWLGLIYYSYLSFLGFNALPFLHRSIVFLYPVVMWTGLFVASFFGVNFSLVLLK